MFTMPTNVPTSQAQPDTQRLLASQSSRSDLLVSSRDIPASFAAQQKERARRYVSTVNHPSSLDNEFTACSPTDDQAAGSGPVYRLPALPPLPSLRKDNVYVPVNSSPYDKPDRLHSSPLSSAKSILGRLGSVRSREFTKLGSYGPLRDVDQGSHVPAGARSNNEQRDMLSMIELNQDRQNAGPLTVPHSLGGGMNCVYTASVRRAASLETSDSRPSERPYLKTAVQQQAERTGGIVAIEEAALFDISVFDGSESVRRCATQTFENINSENKKSYFFPEDLVKPSWRPISMTTPYILMLVLIAVALAGLQEFLCQLSVRPQGLLRFESTSELTTLTYFTWKYLPTIILVIYSVMWQVVDYEVKRLEPYYQLSKREGATAKESLNLDYLTATVLFIPFTAFRYKQWAVLNSSLASIIASSLFAALQSASLTTVKLLDSSSDSSGKVIIRPIVSRLLTSLLTIVAIQGILLINCLRRKSGLLSNPQGIAGVASMATKSHILADFMDLDTATNNIIHNKLQRRRYNLHKSSLWQGEYITSTGQAKLPQKQENPHPVMLRRSMGMLFILYMVLVGTMVPVFLFESRTHQVIERIPFFLISIVTIVKLSWTAMEIELRVMEPYYILSRRQAPPRTLTLDYTGTVPGWLTAKAIINRHWLIAFASFGCICTEVLTVCAASLDVYNPDFPHEKSISLFGKHSDAHTNEGISFRAFWISFALASAILCYLIVIACIIYLRRGHIFLPRQPGSIAGVLAYIHQSKMLHDFINTETKNSRQMTRHLEKLDRTYALGWFTGRDNKDHCGVDSEPISAPYKYGIEWKNSRMRGDEVGGWEHY